MRSFTYPVVVLALLMLGGCSKDSETDTTKADDVRTVPAGEKASVGHLTYSVVDSQVLTQLGEDPTPRIPHDRFMVIQIAVTNSSNVDNPIPAVELVADSGKSYSELTDGTGVTNWLGIVRHVGPGQTERGELVFDAPAAHYKLRFNDESNDKEIMADLPLSYAHEKTNEVLIPTTDAPDTPDATAPGAPKTK